MNLRKQLLTENNCYKTKRAIVPRGIMVHSTGADNPRLSRYVQPNDGYLGYNPNGNHWNCASPDGDKCCHAFIGKLENGAVATYQTLPWDHRGWHCGGDGNNTHIGFEICEDKTDPVYALKAYQEAAELTAYLCRLYGLTQANVISHLEGAKAGIASNHGDPDHWFKLIGKSMDKFRADVGALLGSAAPAAPTENLYRVRKSWGDAASQIGAFKTLEYAKALAEARPGYNVYDALGNQVYPSRTGRAVA